MTPQQDQLRTTLRRVADDVTPLPVADDLWQRGQAARRRGQALVVAAVLAIIASVTWSAVLLGDSDREARTASAPVVSDGAIPSRIPEPDGPVVTDLAFGRASVAYVDDLGQPVLVSPTSGEARHIELPDFPDAYAKELRRQFTGPWLALSPDGTRLAYPVGTMRQLVRGGPMVFGSDWYRVVDLETGRASLLDPTPAGAAPVAVSWAPRGEVAVDLADGTSWTIDPSSGSSRTAALPGVVAPGRGISAIFPTSDDPVTAAPFESAAGDLDRALPADLYPDGASVSPVGWAADSLLVARVDAPTGSYVEGPHLVLMTSPDRPETEWTYRILLRDVPDVPHLSLAVDLVPDLDGTSSQVLTHDFDAPPDQRDISWLIGLGVAAAIAVLMGLRWLWRRLLS